MLSATLAYTASHPPSPVQDVAVGTVLSELGGSKAACVGLSQVGYTPSASFYTVNRACVSSLQAITSIADRIALGRVVKNARDCIMLMGIPIEKAESYAVSGADQDTYQSI